MLVDQLSRTDPGRVDTRVQPIPITSTDEIGEVARAFDQVHREAVRLAAEQALLRGNINAIFTNLSRRNQSLIEGQLTLITELENNEADPDQLENLFRLDHLATRMRRNGENLLVLAGEEPAAAGTSRSRWSTCSAPPPPRWSEYERIELSGVPEAEIHGRAVTDLVHLLAELLENATTFSSPQTKVRVTATRAARRPRDDRDPRQGHRPDRRGLRGHQPQAGQPADRGRRDLAAHGPVRGRPACPTGTASASSCAPPASRRAPPRWSCSRTPSPTVAVASSSSRATSSPSRRSSRSRTSGGESFGQVGQPHADRRRNWASTTAGTPRSRTTYAELDPVGRSLMREARARPWRPSRTPAAGSSGPRRRPERRPPASRTGSGGQQPGYDSQQPGFDQPLDGYPQQPQRGAYRGSRERRIRPAVRRDARPAAGLPGAAAAVVRRAVLAAPNGGVRSPGI